MPLQTNEMINWNLDRFEIEPATLIHLKSLYPFFEGELPKMQGWYLANPRKRKKNILRFMVNWLNQAAQEQGLKTGKYVRANEDFRVNHQEMVKNAAPPPQAWKEMMGKLKPRSA